MNSDRLSILQQMGNKSASNSAYLKKIISELSESEYSWVIDRIRKSNESMPTDFQDSHFFNKIKDSFSILEKTITEKQILFKGSCVVPKPFPAFGTIDQNNYNAFIDISEGSSTIVFNNGLLKLAEHLLTIFTKEQWLKAKKLITDKQRELLARHFLDVMMSYYILLDPYAAIPLEWCEAASFDNLSPEEIYNLDSSFDVLKYDELYFTIDTSIRESAYLWIAAHEYSHFLLNHKTLPKAAQCNTKISETDLSKSWQQELDADLLGAIISMESECSVLTATGIYFALSCIYMSSFDLDEKSHPPVRTRMKNIFDYLGASKEYFVSSYGVIDDVFVPKLQEFIGLIHTIEKEGIRFGTPTDLHEYIYKKYKLRK